MYGTAFNNEFLLKLAILVPEINIYRTITLEFQDFSRVFQDLCLFSGLSRPGNLNILIPGLSRVCKNPVGQLVWDDKKSLGHQFTTGVILKT